jgi:hypothetical protein
MPIDLYTARDARRRLRLLAVIHPELLGPSGHENRAGWEAALKVDEMTTHPTTGFRLAPELLARIDAYAERLSASAGIPVSRAAAVVKLLSERLEEVEEAARPPTGFADALGKMQLEAIHRPFRAEKPTSVERKKSKLKKK